MSVLNARIVKTDKRLGIAIGWATIGSTKGANGEWIPYHDRAGDWLPDEVAEEGFAKFAEGDRILKSEHSGEPIGKCVWIFPMSASTQAALGISADVTGVLIGVKPTDPTTLSRFGKEWQGFSIGGRGAIEEVSP